MTRPAEIPDTGAASIAVSFRALAVLLAADLVFGVLFALGLPSPTGHEDTWIIADRLSGFVAGASAIGFAMAHGFRLSPLVHLRRQDRAEIPITVLCCLLLAAAFNFALDQIGFSTGREFEATSAAARTIEFGSTVLVTPVLEEILFRGVLLQALLKRASHVTAVLVATMVFCVFHLPAVGVVAALLLGIVVGIAFVRTRSVWVCAAGHSAWNLTVTIMDCC